MKAKGSSTEIRKPVEKSERELECKNTYIPVNDPCGSQVSHQCRNSRKIRRSQDSINASLICGDGDIKNIQLSDGGSNFGGFSSPVNRISYSFEQHSGVKQSDGVKKNETVELGCRNINNKECQQEKQRPSLGIMGIKSRRNMLCEFERHDAIEQNQMDQIIEINSDTTTSSEVYKRQKINSQHEFRLFINQHTLNCNSHNNKCSTDTTSDFPVSTPSNPYDRITPLKNTLPSDSFERNLALLTAQTPQMSLDEKINSWKCELDLSDVEDVGSFDDLFKQHEALKKKVVHGRYNLYENISENQYDFTVFRNKVLPRIKAGATFKEKKMDKISNYSVGALSAQRRMRTALEFENKKRQQFELSRLNRAITPTFTSSSENDVVYNSESKPSFKSTTQKGCGQNVCHKNPEKDKNIKLPAHSRVNLIVDKSQFAISSRQIANSRSNEITDFKSNCLSRNVKKKNKTNETNSRGLIQMRLDFAIQNKSQHLHEKKSQLFKTSTMPGECLSSPTPRLLLPIPTPITLNARKINCEFNINDKTPNAEIQLNQSKEYQTPMQKTPVSLEKTEQTCSALPPSSKAAGNFHQQHEFCNYLGLTGMSTANAVANAVAELAKCNLTRRSLRVRRLKQQEKIEINQKLTNDTSNDNELVGKFKSEKISSSPICVQKGSHTNISEDIRFRENNWRERIDPNSSLEVDITKTEESFKKESEIKIVCKISSNCDNEKSIKDCLEKVKTPVRQNLLQFLNPINSNDNSTCPRSSISDVIDGEISGNATQSILKKYNNNLQPEYRLTPTQISTCLSFKNTMTSKSVAKSNCIETQLYNKFKKYLDASRKVKPSIYIVQTINNNEPRLSSQPESNRLLDAGVERSFTEKHMSISKPEVIYLEKHNQSQQRKKSKDKTMKMKQTELLQPRRPQMSLVSKDKKRQHLRKLLALAKSWHKIKNHRPLRGRRILLVKRSRTTPKTSVTQKITPSNQSEHCSTVSMPKSFISKSKGLKLGRETQQGRKTSHKRLHKTRSASRSTPLPADTSSENQNVKASNTVLLSQIRKPYTTMIGSRRKRSKSNVIEEVLLTPADPSTNSIKKERLEFQKSIIESENVVVSSTTNSYDEATLLNLNNSSSQVSGGLKTVQNEGSHGISTTDQGTQSAMPLGIHFISAPSKELPNPVKTINGRIDYVYYEMDVLIIVQEKMVTFWKYFKLINVLAGSQECEKYCHRINNEESCTPTCKSINDVGPQWLPLGECRRLVTDIEILTPYANRICVHNSIPIYIEMRCREIPRERRDCNLLSMYINVYYFNDEDMVAKMHSIQLDAVQGMPTEVIYTTITESRYFVMSWPQENILGKPRSGLCKYSLTPKLDTLASIRDFKHMRHCIRYLECTTDDKLIGFGDTQLTIWDHRSGDVLMNYDFNIKLGRNLGSIYYPSVEIGQHSMLILFQYMKTLKGSETAEVLIIACSVSHTSPSYRILKRFKMPSFAFNTIKNAINTGDNIVITAENNEEIWINCTDPTIITRVPPQNSRRFYPRGKSQIIELTSKTLIVDSFANHVLKLAANPADNCNKTMYVA